MVNLPAVCLKIDFGAIEYNNILSTESVWLIAAYCRSDELWAITIRPRIAIHIGPKAYDRYVDFEWYTYTSQCVGVCYSIDLYTILVRGMSFFSPRYFYFMDVYGSNAKKKNVCTVGGKCASLFVMLSSFVSVTRQKGIFAKKKPSISAWSFILRDEKLQASRNRVKCKRTPCHWTPIKNIYCRKRYDLQNIKQADV